MRRLALATLLLVAGCGSGSEKAQPSPSPSQPIQGVQAFSDLSHAHLGKGAYPHQYPQSPPVGGAHSAAWLKCAIYAQAVPKENAVHSIEHGGVWVTYQPDLPAADLDLVKQLAALNPEYVLISPYAGQDAPVIATTWGLQLKLPKAADPRLVQFVQLYAGGNEGGEKGAGCASTGATLEQALAYDRQQS